MSKKFLALQLTFNIDRKAPENRFTETLTMINKCGWPIIISPAGMHFQCISLR